MRIIGVLLIFLMTFGNTVQAGDLGVILNGQAVHFGAKGTNKTLNENNWGLGLEYEFDNDNKWVPYLNASGFADSLNYPSYYAGGGYKRRYQFGDYHLDLGGLAFVMTRKDLDNYRPFFGVVPIASFGTQSIAVNMTYVPKIRPKWTELFFFQLNIKVASF